MRKVTFYDNQTGIFHQKLLYASDDSAVAINTPAGHTAIDGHFDVLRQKVDIATGEVVDYQPPSPGDTYIWDDTKKRWVLCPKAVNKAAAVTAAKAEIAQLEALHNGAVRDFLLRGDKSKLEAIDAKISELHESLK